MGSSHPYLPTKVLQPINRPFKAHHYAIAQWLKIAALFNGRKAPQIEDP